MNRDLAARIGLTTLVACAVITTGITVYRTLAPSPGMRPPQDHRISDSLWHAVLASGRRIGPSSAPITIVEFADFECPACRSFELSVVAKMRRLYPNDFAVQFHHWPLPYHHLAYPAARAAECAAAQDRFAAFHDMVYELQDSLGLKSFASFATQSGVPDSAAFTKCVSTPDLVAAIESDVALAKLVGGGGTPTILVEGVVLGSVPDSSALVRILTQRRQSAVPMRSQRD